MSAGIVGLCSRPFVLLTSTFRTRFPRTYRPPALLTPSPSPHRAFRLSAMSDSEASAGYRFDDDSGSEGYVASPKVTKAAAKKAPARPKAVKAPAAKKAAPKKAPLATKKNLPNDSVSEVDADEDDDFDASPVKAKSKSKPADDGMDIDDVENVPAGGSNPPAAKKSASDTYQKLTQLEHVLKRPDTYIGSVQAVQEDMWVFDEETKMMARRFSKINYVPGFFKIFDEILVNAADNKTNDESMDTIKVTIDRQKNQISVFNNGRGIPVEMHKKEGVMIPELIFGHLLAGSNFDDDQKKLTGGRNGYGAKLANIYSHEFIVETADRTNGKKWKQVFTNNMSKKGTPKVTENKKDEEWTQITFTPDLQRFGMDSIDDDINALLMKRVYDLAGTVRDVKVFLNGERLKIKNFKQYVEMYLNSATKEKVEAGAEAATAKPTVIFEQVNKRWEVAFALSEGEMRHVSFANSISTSKGGTHVEMIATQLANKLIDQVKKKNKAAPVKPFQIKSHMWIFVTALIENPTFDSQTKETLTLKSTAFGSKCELSEDFVKKVSKSGIIDNVLSWAKFKQDQMLKKTDGSKRSRISGIVKLEDANNAGGRNAKNCTLILTEGDSAKALAVSGLSVVGRDNYGVFPLRGKLLNVREASFDQINKNTEIAHIKQILGLKHKQKYTSTDSLRYGHLMIMTDQDHDGSHIKGLIINFLDHSYPELLEIPNFLVEFITPIVKAKKGAKELAFYTMPQYEEWKAQIGDEKGWTTKYFKGLGSSKSEDAKKYFSDLGRHRLQFETATPEDKALIDMAFSKKKADERKEWLRQFRPGTFLDHDVKSIPISDFVNKELILFSMADNIRSIPSVADGLKPGQRKVMFACFKKNLTKEIKVAQLQGYVSEQTAYHHGEQSLAATIIGLAQNYVGSNNINLLEPGGQFGTRIAGGKDAASARYIFTSLPKITRTIFHPADDGLLKYQVEDGDSIEPEYYLPTVPLVLINGADGIGTGWSTAIPNFNPVDIVDNLRRIMRGEEPVRMDPWFRGFTGSIERVDADKYKVSGILEKIGDNTVEITELPVRRWTQDFKEMLEEMTNEAEKVPAVVKDYEEHHTDLTVHFKVHMTNKGIQAAETEGLDKKFKMTTTIGTGNMVCFDLNGKIRKYSTAEEILVDFYHKRLEFYGLRKQHLADELNKQFEKLSNQARFVQMIVDKQLVVSGKKKAIVVAELRELKFRPFPKGKKREDVEAEPALEEEDDGQASDYDYLLGMAIWSLTREKVEKLLAERDGKENELIELLKLSPQDIWNRDLDNFLKEWYAVLDADVEALKGSKPKTKAAIKAAIKKKRKADGDDSESDDFKPTKAVAKPKVTKAKTSPVKASPKRSSAHVSASDDDKPLTKKPALPKVAAKAKAPIMIDSDDDMYELPAPKPAAAATKTKPKQTTLDGFSAAPKKPAASASKPSSDQSDDDLEIKAPAKPAPAKKAAAAKPKPKPKAKIVELSEEEEASEPESDFEAITKPPKKAAAAAGAAKKKSKKDESDFGESSGSDDFVAPPPRPAAARPGRGATKKAAYVDLDDDSDE